MLNHLPIRFRFVKNLDKYKHAIDSQIKNEEDAFIYIDHRTHQKFIKRPKLFDLMSVFTL
jgi:hypothetical protein